MITEVIQTEGLTKHYRDVKAVEAVDLHVKQGEIYGFLGLNGAGKTTTIRMLLGMIRPTRGAAYLFGTRIEPGNMGIWNKVGHLVEMPYSYPELTVLETLEVFRRLRLRKDPKLVSDVLEKLNLGRYRNIRVKNLSLGNAQRLGIAKAIFHHPGLLILDEPANGLDPSGIVQIRELLADLSRNQGVTIFISSHILGEISKFATRIGIIHEGQMIRESDAEQLHNARYRALLVNTLDNAMAAESLVQKGYAPGRLSDGSIELKDTAAIDHPEQVSSLLVSLGIPPTRIAVEEEDLEHFFFRIIQTNRLQS